MDEIREYITPADHELYLRTIELHMRNNTINHEEDERPVLEIVSAGLEKMSDIYLG
ncbi:MAG: hypothetical protein IJB09_07940 [Oscillospiraceae bacterium]|nr:hypothetical protein [Oscillospiraceae bacterium]